MIYGITEQGFVRKPYQTILEELSEQALSGEYFGAEADLSDDSPLGVFIKLMAWAIDRQWQTAEDVYYAMWLSTSEGVSLDRVTKLGFVSRQPAAYADVTLRFTGTAGSPIPAGTQTETVQNVVFETVVDTVVSGEGTVDVLARCMEAGTVGLVASGMITFIKTPVSGVDDVTNPSPSSGGRNIESDYELVERYSNLPAATGSSVPALYAALMNVESVVAATVFENTGNATDSNGLPPKSIEAVVQGGDDTDVAEMIFEKKAGGIDTHGSEEVVIIDNQGIERTILFSRPENVNVYVIYEIETNDEWSEDNEIVMKRKAVEYIGGIDDLFVEHEGVGISETVYAWKLIASQSAIPGIDSISVRLGTAPAPAGSDNIDFLPRQRAWSDTSMISVVTS